MKTLLKLLLVCTLALSLSCAAGEGSHAPITDPKLIFIEAPGPDYSPLCDLGGGRIYCISSEGSYAVYDLYADTITPLSLQAEDLPHWKQMVVEAFRADAKNIAPEELPDDPDYLLYAMEPATHYTINGSRYALFPYIGILDTETALLLPLPRTEYQLRRIMPNDELLCYESSEEGITFQLLTIDGELLRTGFYPLGEDVLPEVYAVGDSLLILLQSYASGSYGFDFSCVLLDRELQAGPVIPLGHWYNNQLRVNLVHRSTLNGRILLSTLGFPYSRLLKVDGKMVKGEALPYLTGLLVIDPATGRIWQAARNVDNPCVLGMSSDGSFALVGGMLSPLYKLDMETLTLTEQMPRSELIQMVQPYMDSTIPVSLWSYPGNLCWFGGDYAVHTRYPYCVFRVVNK